MAPDCEDGVGTLTGAAAALSEGVDDADDGGAGDGAAEEVDVACAAIVTDGTVDSVDVVTVTVVDAGKEVLGTVAAGTATEEAEAPTVGVAVDENALGVEWFG